MLFAPSALHCIVLQGRRGADPSPKIVDHRRGNVKGNSVKWDKVNHSQSSPGRRPEIYKYKLLLCGKGKRVVCSGSHRRPFKVKLHPSIVG